MSKRFNIMSEILGKLDSPLEGTQIGNQIIIQGWAFSKPSTEILFEIYLDDQIVDKGIGEFPRFDVFQKYSLEEAYTSGFFGRLEFKSKNDGLHTIEVKAISKNAEKSLGKVTVIKNTNPNVKVENQIPLGSIGRGIRKKNVGIDNMQILKDKCGLNPNDVVLDIGFGMGGIATPLTNYLNNNGRYEGLDVVPTSINYCKNHITKRFPNFHFSLIDIYNKLYNPDGKYVGSNYKFPFDENTFDLIFLFSVFTHMLPQYIRKYFSEINRVLKPGKKCLMTFFLLNEEIKQRINQGLSAYSFKNEFDGYWAETKAVPENAIAYEEDFIIKTLVDNKLVLNKPIFYGTWSGLEGRISHQEVLIVEKNSA